MQVSPAEWADVTMVHDARKAAAAESVPTSRRGWLQHQVVTDQTIKLFLCNILQTFH
jgi:hypothetical protein